MTTFTVVRDPLNPRIAIVDTPDRTAVIIAPEGRDPDDLTGYERLDGPDPRGIIY